MDDGNIPVVKYIEKRSLLDDVRCVYQDLDWDLNADSKLDIADQIGLECVELGEVSLNR
jgi:ssDNA-specific exonuclease RecJ